METLGLRDGTPVTIRPVRPEDKPLYTAGFERFGEQSRYRRFLGLKKRLTLAAIDPVTGEGVGVARYICLQGAADTAEAAVAIVDDWQHRGLGGALLSRLAARAREEGVRRFRAWMLAESRDMLHLFERLGPLRVRARQGDTVEIEVDLDALSSPAAGR
jgi:GNAT superfamily N-acetyltransferase